MENDIAGKIVYWRNQSIYLNITNRCTNNCLFCVRKYQTGVFGFNLQLEKEPTKEEILNAINQINLEGFNEIVFTGFGEPLVRLNLVLELIKELKKQHPQKNIRIDTNGLVGIYFPKRNVAEELKEARLDAISISLNAENSEIYDKICRPTTGSNSYQKLVDFITSCKDKFETKLTVVDIPQIDITICSKFAEKLNLPLKIRQYSGPEIDV